MSNIFGTIITLGEFLKNENTQVRIIRGDGYEQPFILTRNRKYVIPDYQREIRWTKKHLVELVSDLSRGEKFLGNIILNQRPDFEYEVIDGQQRITVLLMLIYYIKSKFNQELDILETCELKMANFSRFDILAASNFNINGLGEADLEELNNSDVFKQRGRYEDLWGEFERIESLRTAIDCDVVLTNLKRSQVNLIANTIDTDNISIDYFLDVNLKGVKLDTEDIFKGYLFRHDSGQPIRDEWKTLKVSSFKLNEKTDYPVIKLLEHYMYCSLYKEERYRNVQFREDFTIKETVLDGRTHYTGEHIIKVIKNNAYMLDCIKKINKFLSIVINIVNSESPDQSFKDLFNNSAAIDSVEKTIIYNFIRKIMLDKSVVPRILIMKYIIEVLFSPVNKSKEDYRKIYGLYFLAVIFTVFEGEKDIKKVTGTIKDTNWYIKAVEQAKGYFSRDNISKSRVVAQYQLLENEEDFSYMYRCKSLATIYNYFVIDRQTVKIRSGKLNELKDYLTDGFTTEHFIVNESGSYKISNVTTTKTLDYPSKIKKYANSIFNYIFIPQTLNNDLNHFTLPEKINILDQKIPENPDTVKCEYSKMILEACRTTFSLPIEFPIVDTEQTGSNLNEYYDNQFIQEFNNFAFVIIREIGNKIGA